MPTACTWVFCHSLCDCLPLVIPLNAGQNQREMDAYPCLFSSWLPVLRQVLFLSASFSSFVNSVKPSIPQDFCHNCDYYYPHYHHIINKVLIMLVRSVNRQQSFNSPLPSYNKLLSQQVNLNSFLWFQSLFLSSLKVDSFMYLRLLTVPNILPYVILIFQ